MHHLWVENVQKNQSRGDSNAYSGHEGQDSDSRNNNNNREYEESNSQNPYQDEDDEEEEDDDRDEFRSGHPDEAQKRANERVRS